MNGTKNVKNFLSMLLYFGYCLNTFGLVVRVVGGGWFCFGLGVCFLGICSGFGGFFLFPGCFGFLRGGSTLGGVSCSWSVCSKAVKGGSCGCSTG